MNALNHDHILVDLLEGEIGLLARRLLHVPFAARGQHVRLLVAFRLLVLRVRAAETDGERKGILCVLR